MDLQQSSLAYWASGRDSTSRQRSASTDEFAAKARDFAGFMSDGDRSMPAVDLGCGAGELLDPLSRLIRVEMAIEVSPVLASSAMDRCSGRGIDFRVGDARRALSRLKQQVWLTSSALNQYSSRDGLAEVVRSFRDNPKAQSLYAFDTIDPWRYLLMPKASSFAIAARGSWRGSLYRAANTRHLLLARSAVSLGNPTMGFGIYPRYWRVLAESFGLNLRFAGSEEYEYRYHVALHKPSVGEREDPQPTS